MNRPTLLFTLAWALCCVLHSAARAETISYFRRHGGVTTADKQPLPERLDTPGRIVWRQPLAQGHSTLCIQSDLIFLTTHRDKELALVALDRHTGKVRWKKIAPAEQIEPHHRAGSPAASSPACDGQRVYVFFGSYGLLCYDLEGKLLWSREMGPFQDEFGACSSPVLVDGKIVLNQDHDIDSFLIAVDCASGRTAWKVPREDATRSYSTPIVSEVNGRQQIIVAGSLRLTAYDPADGRRRWWMGGLARIVNTTPAQGGGLLYVASSTPGGDATERISLDSWPRAAQQWDKDKNGKITRQELPDGPVLLRFFRIDLNQDGGLDRHEWNKHARIFELAQNSVVAVRPGGSGDVSQSHVLWKFRRGLPSVPSPLHYRNVIYLVKNGGILTTLDASTGKLHKQGRLRGRGNYYASPAAGDGKVYLASEQGVITVVQAAVDWKILSSHDFSERIMASPVIDGGRIYVRTDEAMYCFGK